MAPSARSDASQPGLLIQFRPLGPWRPGPESGARDRVDRVYHSDTLFSAVSGAMLSFGWLEEWLDATARAAGGAEVCFSSCFPYQGQTLFVPPPRGLWPPPPSAKVRWKGARFVPFSVVERLIAEKPVEEDRWRVDGFSQCLLPTGKPAPASGPLRVALRSNAAVDRMGGATEVHTTACLEFSADSGLWAAVLFAGDEARARWADRLIAALRLLADSGFGGERSRGWGHSEAPKVTEGNFPDLLLRSAPASNETPAETGYWLLSLFSPSEEDRIDWQNGNYAVVLRSGRSASTAASGVAKRVTRMVSEGSVLVAAEPPVGTARDVAPEGFPHPVFRAGFAVAVPIPWRSSARAATRPHVGELPPPVPAAEPESAEAEEAAVETAVPAAESAPPSVEVPAPAEPEPPPVEPAPAEPPDRSTLELETPGVGQDEPSPLPVEPETPSGAQESEPGPPDKEPEGETR